MTVVATTATASNSPATPGVFTVPRTGNTSASLAVSYSMRGTAVPGTDYTALSDSVTIPAGQSSAPVTVTRLPGATAVTEPSVILTLASGTGYTPGTPSTATVTITEPIPVLVTVAATTASASKKPVKAGVFMVSRTGSTNAPLTVSYSMGGTALSGTDYRALSGTFTLRKGKASAAVTVTPLAASTATGSRTAVLALTGETGYKIGSPGPATVTIDEGTAPAGKLSVSPTSLCFGTIKTSAGSKRLAFTIRNTGEGPLSVTVGTLAAPFSDNAPRGAFTLLPHGSQKVTVTYRPVRGVPASAKLAVVGGGVTVNVTLSGGGKG